MARRRDLRQGPPHATPGTTTDTTQTSTEASSSSSSSDDVAASSSSGAPTTAPTGTTDTSTGDQHSACDHCGEFY